VSSRRFASLLVAAVLLAPVAGAQTTRPSARADTAGRDTTRRAQPLETLTITTSRAGADAVAQTTLGPERLSRDYSGQDVPLSLRTAPSVTAYSESGSLSNYSYFRLRGVDQSRINITLDGVPLNEPEDQQIYFADFPDLTSSLASAQLQRGVGTSTYGQAAFGGALNLASFPLAGSARGGALQLGGGSFGAARGTLAMQSGLLPNGFAFSGRLSGLRSDGYRRGATNAANGAFVSGGYFGARDLVKLTASTGLERNGQAYATVPDSVLRVDPRNNPLAGVGDHYRESFATVNYTRLITPSASAGITAYGFDTRGYYDYPSGAPGPALRYRSSSRWGGLVAAAHATRGALTLDAGAHAMTYAKDHEFDARPDLGYPAYANTGHKSEASAFAKASLALGAVTLFGDLQARTARFRYEPTAGYGLSEASQRWSFVNPKAGVTLRAAPGLTVYASFGTTGREPTRGDLFAGADDVTPEDAPALLPLTRVRPEHVNDLEAGAQIARGPVTLSLGVYDMRFRDEIARTGATTPLGYDIRANVGRSYRRGIEADLQWSLSPEFDVGLTAATSRNRIASYRDEAAGTIYRDVEPILTPAFIGGHRATWRPASWLAINADGRYQSRSFLAPTGDDRLTAAAFYMLDGGLTFLGDRASDATWWRNRLTVTVTARNLLDRHAYPTGDVSGDGVPRYIILAPRSADVTVRVPF
jgi:iron complex outermembrane receptor protein